MMISASCGEGHYRVECQAILCGEDVNAVFTGGERAHIGAVSLAVYEPVRDSATVSTITVYAHRDDQLAALAAKKLATALKCTASVSVGIHVDDATETDIELLCSSFQGCLHELIRLLVLKQVVRSK